MDPVLALMDTFLSLLMSLERWQSLAFHRGAALADIIQAVGWSSATTFGRFYLRHMEVRQSDSVPEETLRLPA